MEGCFGTGGEPVESLWVSRQTHKGDVVGVSYRPPDQGEVEEAFRQLKKASCSQVQVLMGSLNHPHICWSGNSRAQAIQVSGVHW